MAPKSEKKPVIDRHYQIQLRTKLLLTYGPEQPEYVQAEGGVLSPGQDALCRLAEGEGVQAVHEQAAVEEGELAQALDGKVTDVAVQLDVGVDPVVPEEGDVFLGAHITYQKFLTPLGHYCALGFPSSLISQKPRELGHKLSFIGPLLSKFPVVSLVL